MERYRREVSRLQQEQYMMAHDFLCHNGYDHYEVSNYCRQDYMAVHNSNYWSRKEYVGYGPAAHSYGDGRRSWNIANNALYIKELKLGSLPMQEEVLSETDIYNEFIMLGLRTAKGISKSKIDKLSPYLKDYWNKTSLPLIESKVLLQDHGSYQLHRDYWYVSDHITSELFYL